MTDGHDEQNSDEFPEQAPVRRGAADGVRILGAEEAQAVLDTGDVSPRLGEYDTRHGDVPARPDPDIRPAARFPLTDDEVPSQAASLFAEIAATSEVEGGPAAPLPHWTEPPTGEMPIILIDEADEDTDDTVIIGTAPRFRTGTADWAESDFEPIESLADDEPALGALGAPPEDDDRAFDREVAARRSGGSTGKSSRRPSADDHEPPGTQADLTTRVITGVGLAVLVLVCLSMGRSATMVLVTAVVGVAAFELFQALHRRGFRPATLVAIVGCLVVTPIAYSRGEFAFGFTLVLVTIFTLLWYLFEVVKTRPVVNVAATLFGFVYVGILGGYAGLLLSYEHGVGLILGVGICVVGYDVVGYLVGSQFGRSRLAAAVSPNKTVEGLIGGCTASIVLALLVVNRITPWNDLGDALALGVAIAVAAPFGDLCESMIKRDLGIKDFGSVLPGHGGFLDRFDALLFCLPVTYYVARALDVIG